MYTVVEVETHTDTKSIKCRAYWIFIDVMEKNDAGKVLIKVLLKRHFE